MTDSRENKDVVKNEKRKTIAIGDLHGDYDRLIRIMNEHNLLIEGTWVWNPEASNVDFILIGDYVDWRGEPLEGDPSRWEEGPKRILHLLFYLKKKLREYAEKDSSFKSAIYPILGNHDQMMLDATDVFEFMDFEQLNNIIRFKQNYVQLKKYLNEIRLDYEQIEKIMKYLNWYYQGGEKTIKGFGGMEVWKNEMEGELGSFLREKLVLGVVVNKRLYAHSLPDRREFWKKMEEIAELPERDWIRARDAFIWGRRIWGIDAYTNMKTPRPEIKEIDDMLSRMGAEGAVVGHTPMLRRDPVVDFEGRIINIDLHGIPGSGAFIEEYEIPQEAAV
ncbi:MAG: metallophosphoesterase [Firmicutes bacterium]|nr:metallophosphoesterase [Bacillota bacterium]